METGVENTELVEPTRFKSAVDTGVAVREQKRVLRAGRGDIRAAMKAKPKAKGNHAKAPAGVGPR